MTHNSRRRVLVASAVLCLAKWANAQSLGKTARVVIVSVRGETSWAWTSRFAAKGYVEGRNLSLVALDWYETPRDEVISREAAEIVASKPDAICVASTKLAQVFQRLTRDIPLVFYNVGDPLAAGLVKTLAKPGGNVTGVTNRLQELVGKRLELLKAIQPATRRVAFVVSPGEPLAPFIRNELKKASAKLGIQIAEVSLANFARPAALAHAIREAKADSMVLGAWQVRGVDYEDLIEILRKERIPVVFDKEENVETGALVSLGESNASYDETLDYVVGQVTRILKGEHPSTIAVSEPSKIYLAINLKTAAGMGITIPESIRIRADRIVD